MSSAVASSRPPTPRPSTGGRRVGRLLLVAVAIAVIAGAAVPAALMYRRLHPARLALTDDPGRHGLAYRDVEFPSPLDGTTLRGWDMPATHPTQRAILIVPGIDDDRLVSGITLRLAPALLDAGFDVLAFDLRAEGTSGGDLETFGGAEQWDVLGAVAEARRLGARSVGALGFSMGAASAILAAARSPGLAAIVADSSFAVLADTLTHELTVNDGLPGPAAAYGLALFRLLSGFDPASVAPVDALSRMRSVPILLIQGGADRTVPPAESLRLLDAAGPSATRWFVSAGEHAKSYLAEPGEYTRRVVAFFEAALR